MKRRIQKRRIQSSSLTLLLDEKASGSSSHRKNRQLMKSNRMILLCFSILLILELITPQATFSFQCTVIQQYRISPTISYSTKDEAEEEEPTTVVMNNSVAAAALQTTIDHELEQQINIGLQRAKEILEKSKAKMAAKQKSSVSLSERQIVVEKEQQQQQVPFFARNRTSDRFRHNCQYINFCRYHTTIRNEGK
jgi:hypothetical protein